MAIHSGSSGHYRLATSLVMGLALALALAVPATAAPMRIPFAGVFYGCDGTDGTEFVSGNVLHFRNATNDNLWVTGNPLLDGPEHNVVMGNINLATGYGVAFPRTSVHPDAYDGTWEIEIVLKVSPDGLTGHGQGRGTGELRGMTLSFSNPGAIVIDPTENPCSDFPFAAMIEGEILAPNGLPQ